MISAYEAMDVMINEKRARGAATVSEIRVSEWLQQVSDEILKAARAGKSETVVNLPSNLTRYEQQAIWRVLTGNGYVLSFMDEDDLVVIKWWDGFDQTDVI